VLGRQRIHHCIGVGVVVLDEQDDGRRLCESVLAECLRNSLWHGEEVSCPLA
jgi:hypothetical protein